jgi:FlaA1/EpsC-like NDP-sugar epimerase
LIHLPRLPFVRKLTGLQRPAKQSLMIASDLVLLGAAAWLAFEIGRGESPGAGAHWLMIVAAPVLALPVFLKAGLYRTVIRYLGEHALWSIVRAMGAAAGLWAVVSFVAHEAGDYGLSLSVPVLYGLIGILLIAALRFGARWLLGTPVRQGLSGPQVLIYGAGNAGRQLAASLRTGRELCPAGFLDDDPELHGKEMDGLTVHSPDRLRMLVDRLGIRDVIVTIPSASAARRRAIAMFLEQYDLRVRSLPAMTDIASGKHRVNMIPELDISELLGRDVVNPVPTLMGRCITGKTVLVTGAGGSIGGELCRQIIAQSPSGLILLDSSEFGLYQIERRLRAISDVSIVPVLGSIGDETLLRSIFARQRVQTIYHAAAYKHVAMVESNMPEGVANNVIGTLALARAASAADIETFVLISSDKAVRPTNVMGATKRWAELIIQHFARVSARRGSRQRYCAVRFGNVLGSSGSVVPLFREQILQGGPITVTHPDVTRYFMSIHEAVELVIQAGSLADGGEIFLLDMGEPVRIYDLARNMIRLAGHSPRDADHPDGDIEIKVIGLRPGEKMFEELLIASGNAQSTIHPKITRSNEPSIGGLELEAALDVLQSALTQKDLPTLRNHLMSFAGGIRQTAPE